MAELAGGWEIAIAGDKIGQKIGEDAKKKQRPNKNKNSLSILNKNHGN